MLEFLEVSFRNFFSYGSRDVVIDLTKYKTTLLTGDSGSGKSTIISESLTFGLFGKPFRKIKKADVCNTVNGKDCLITIKFRIGTDNYKVVRGVKPDIFEIYLNDIMINQNPNVRDYQKHLENNILQMSYKVWMNLVVLGFANHSPFMTMSAGDRRTMVDEVLGIEAFQGMLQISKEKVTDLKQEIKDLDAKIESNTKTKEVQKKNLHQLREQESSRSDDLQTEISKLQEEVDVLSNESTELSSSLAELRGKTSQKKGVSDKAKELNSILAQASAKRKMIEEQLNFIESNTSCPTCNQEIGEEHKHNFSMERTSKAKTMDLAISSLSVKIEEQTTLLKELELLVEQSVKIDTKVNSNAQKIHYIQKSITEKQQEISKILSADNSLIKQLAESIIELSEDTKKIENCKKELQDELRIIVFCQSLLKEDGIKGKIIGMYLPVLTKLVNDYLEKMQFMMRIQFDDNFNETIYARFRDKLTFTQLSQGEQSRINIAVILAWRELAEMRNSIKCNLIIADELLDAAISTTDAETVLEMLKAMATKQHIYIISHRPDQVASYVDNIIKVEKRGNFSLITEGA